MWRLPRPMPATNPDRSVWPPSPKYGAEGASATIFRIWLHSPCLPREREPIAPVRWRPGQKPRRHPPAPTIGRPAAEARMHRGSQNRLLSPSNVSHRKLMAHWMPPPALGVLPPGRPRAFAGGGTNKGGRKAPRAEPPPPPGHHSLASKLAGGVCGVPGSASQKGAAVLTVAPNSLDASPGLCREWGAEPRATPPKG